MRRPLLTLATVMTIATGVSSAASGCDSAGSETTADASTEAGAALDSARADETSAADAGGCDPYTAFRQPQVLALPGPPGDKTSAFFSDDELRAVYDVAVDDGDGGFRGEIFEATRPSTSAPFSDAKKLVEINIGRSQSRATLTADFRTVYFSSHSRLTAPVHVYRATRTDLASPFGPATELGSLDVQGLDTYSAFPARHAPELWVSRGEPNIGAFIDRASLGADGAPAPPARVAELDSGEEKSPVLAANGLAIYWSTWRMRPKDGGGDIWVATRESTSAPFRDLRPLEPSSTGTVIGRAVNSVYWDYPVWISVDQCRLYSISSADQPRQEIFVAERAR